MAFAIGGKRVLGQAAKFSGRQDTFGDAQSERVVCECKAHDPAPKKWRQDNPQQYYDKIKIQIEWLDKIRAESEVIGKFGFLAYNIKFSGLQATIAIIPIKDIDQEMGYIGPSVIVVDGSKKQFTMSIDNIPTLIKIGDDIYKCLMLAGLMYEKPQYFAYSNIDKLIEAWKNKGKDNDSNS